MHDNKVSLWLEDALAAGALLLLIYAAPPFVLSLEREAKPITVDESQVKCPVTISQYGPGERWIPNQPAPVCAVAARELPAHILTSPLGGSE